MKLNYNIINRKEYVMGYQDKTDECVGCDAKTEGTIRKAAL